MVRNGCGKTPGVPPEIGSVPMERSRTRLTRLLDQYSRPSRRLEAGAEWPEIREVLEAHAVQHGLRIPWRTEPAATQEPRPGPKRKSR